MADRRKILVTGATGAQGGSVVRHLLRRGTFDVRGLTRNPESEKARELKNMGVEVVAGTMDDVQSLQKGMQGCWGVFGVTSFWEHFDREFEHGQNLIKAVEAERPDFFIYSSLPNPRHFGKGELEVPHFEFKARLEEEIRRMPIRSAFVHCAFYYENFVNFGVLQRGADGSLGFGMPQGDTKLAGVATDDIGGVVAAMFEQPDEFAGKVVGAVGDDLTGTEYAEILTRAIGEKVTYTYIPRDVYAGFGFPGAEDLANMFEMNRLYIPNRAADIAESKRLNPGMQRFEEWAMSHKSFFAPVKAVKA